VAVLAAKQVNPTRMELTRLKKKRMKMISILMDLHLLPVILMEQ